MASTGGTASGPGGGPSSGGIPPIEIGSFVAPQPDKSEFIGSASGVFFVHTVFRAFADASGTSPDAPLEPSFGTGTAGHTSNGDDVADPGSAHNFLVASENTQDPAPDIDGTAPATPPSGRGYGVAVSGIGRAPDLHIANRLVMLYFKNWHPMFPFLHGPSFFKEVGEFYELDERRDESVSDQHVETCRAVIFQCIFNIAASSDTSSSDHLLPPECRIESTLALTHLLGLVSSTNTALTLQALLAMELYLIGRASLRAASTVHGALTRMLYHLGLHRCPYRYVQLPSGICNLRQRIFWSAYVLDRYLSQALGHPASISDIEIDTCIPGMKELHQPVRPRDQPDATVSGGPQNEIQAHLPKTPSSAGHKGGDTVTGGAQDVVDDRHSVPSPAHHHRTRPDEAGEYVLAYLATYSRLLGRILTLFHVSIHARDITWDKVLSLTCQIQGWWNSLPSALQDDRGASSHYAPLFLVLYNSLVLFVNRPFLSLPTHRADFLSSLQAALTASRTIVVKLRRVKESAALFWLGTLSAVWMSGLVIAFASLLGHYPFEKAEMDLQDCLHLFSVLGGSGPSAKRCQTALRTLLDKLKKKNESPSAQLASEMTANHERNHEEERRSRTPAAGQRHGKRRRLNGDVVSLDIPPVQPLPMYDPFANTAAMPGSNFWQPVLEYTGPDFGFDSTVMDGYGLEQQGLLQNFDIGAGGLYSSDMWEAYLQGAGDNLNF